MTTFTYFAYGSNMLTERLRQRCPSARPKGIAVARGYSLSFCKRSNKDGSGKATLLADDSPGAEVHGVLFEIDQNELPKLDKAEGEGSGYDREDEFKVVDLSNRQEIEAKTYLISSDWRDDSLKPYDWYHALVLAGALQHNLPSSHIETLRQATTRSDPDLKRNEDALHTLQCAGFGILLSSES